ncbi:TonB-dependent receptor domain-containing protein [Shewanella intestini]|uniref:TonB-dependent receptor n=1 Tax=Shewanella intestini TaxID=2017544 RepID=A0ABS5HXF8_9GAMM|nr:MULTISPECIES: TonB-dependent receptor [Shewanella]MBR9726433.1 TonB-dependent receptor [Shewanella intestini]
MSSRSFSLTFIASSLLALLHCPSVVANDTSTMSAINQVNIEKDLGAYHYRDSETGAAQGGVVVLPAANYHPNTLVNRGAVNGVAVMQDRIFYSPAPYSGNLTLAPNLFFQDHLSVEKYTEVGVGGEGSFGVINYQSATYSPQHSLTELNLEAGQQGEVNAGVLVSSDSKPYRMLFGVDYQMAADDVGLNKGFDSEHKQTDILFKISADSLPGAKNPQTTEFSFQYEDKDTDGGLLGLTQDDFELTPNKQYQVSQHDNESNKRIRYAIAHQVRLVGLSVVNTDFYYQTYSQNTLQMQFVDGVEIDPTLLAMLAQFETSAASDLSLTGLSQNNDFDGFGVQSEAVSQYGPHRVNYRARYHHDKAEMRIGSQDWIYGQDLSLTSNSSEPELVEYTDDATALLTAVDGELNYGQWQIRLGLAYETVDVSRENKNTTVDIADVDFTNDAWLPSIGVEYHSDNWSAAMLAKKAWTAASAGNAEQKAQQAMQYEVNAQYQSDRLAMGLSVYFHDYDNQHLSCMWGVVCDFTQRSIEDNIANVQVVGGDVSFAYTAQFDHFEMPIKANYLYAQAQLDDANCSASDCQLPWVPEHQAFISSGVKVGSFALMAQALYQSQLGYQLDNGENYSIESQWKLNVASTYQINPQHQVYLRVENVLDQDLIAQSTRLGVISQGEQKAVLGYEGYF